MSKLTKEKINQISRKLKQMVEADQSHRSHTPHNWEKIQLMDREHHKQLKTFVQKYGLIDIGRFGKEASKNAWLIVQHTPKSEFEFMKKYLTLMEEGLNKIDMKNYAYLKDRVLIYSNKKQKYATQYRLDKENNVYYFNDLYQPKTVDNRRKKFGLPTLMEYIKTIETLSNIKVKIPTGYLPQL
jgi:hypothetical protein